MTFNLNSLSLQRKQSLPGFTACNSQPRSQGSGLHRTETIEASCATPRVGGGGGGGGAKW